MRLRILIAQNSRITLACIVNNARNQIPRGKWLDKIGRPFTRLSHFNVNLRQLIDFLQRRPNIFSPVGLTIDIMPFIPGAQLWPGDAALTLQGRLWIALSGSRSRSVAQSIGTSVKLVAAR